MKNIPKVISMLMLVNKKVFSKNWNLLSLLSIKKEAITIPNILNLLLSIFFNMNIDFPNTEAKIFCKT